MLCLTRNVGASIVIGENIKLTVLKVRGKQVQIGIEAPSDVKVFREELLNKLNGGESDTSSASN